MIPPSIPSFDTLHFSSLPRIDHGFLPLVLERHLQPLSCKTRDHLLLSTYFQLFCGKLTASAYKTYLRQPLTVDFKNSKYTLEKGSTSSIRILIPFFSFLERPSGSRIDRQAFGNSWRWSKVCHALWERKSRLFRGHEQSRSYSKTFLAALSFESDTQCLTTRFLLLYNPIYPPKTLDILPSTKSMLQ